MSRAKSLIRDSATYGTAGVLAKAAALLTVPYFTRLLGPADYGLADLATSLAALLTILARFGGDIPTMRHATRLSAEERTRVYASYVAVVGALAGVMVLGLLPLTHVIADTLWSTPDASGIALATLLLVPLSATQSAVINLLRFEGRSSQFALLAAIDLGAEIGASLLLVSLGFGALGIVLGLAIGSAVGLLAAAATSIRFVGRPSMHVGTTLVREGLPFLPAMMAFVLADAIVRIAAADRLGLRDVGQLALALRFASVVALASSAFAAAWGPRGLALSVTVASARTFGALLTAQIGIFGAAAVALGAFSPELAYLLGGGDFAPASRLVPGLVLSTGLGATLFVLITAAGVLRRGRWVAYATLGGATCEVVVVYVVIHSLGIEALAAGAVAGRLAGVVILAAAVTDVARISRVGVLFLIVSVGLVVLITLLNATPETSLMWRASIGVVAVLAGTYLLIRLARTSPSEPRSATSTS